MKVHFKDELIAHLTTEFGTGTDLSTILLHEIEDAIYDFLTSIAPPGYDPEALREVAEATAARLEASILPTS